MIYSSEISLVFVLLSVLLCLSTSRLTALVKYMALQGAAVSLVPLLLRGYSEIGMGEFLFFLVMILIKMIAIPCLLFYAVRRMSVKREIEPFIGYNASIIIGLITLIVSVFITNLLELSLAPGRAMALITAITTMASGFFLMMARKKAITQVIGYLMLENGIYLIGTALTKHSHTMYIVEFGVLLDLLVAVMIMGIILHNINNTFDDVDTTLLGRLKD